MLQPPIATTPVVGTRFWADRARKNTGSQYPPPTNHPRGGRGRRIVRRPGRRALGLMASGATCVQKLDGSRDSAIHTKYRILLRSSSMREPRYPLPRVVLLYMQDDAPNIHPRTGARGAISLLNFLGAVCAGVRCLTRVASLPPIKENKLSPPAKDDTIRPRPNDACPVERRVHGSFCCAVFDNDPSAGSPTETLLRLLLPLNDKVQWTSCDVAGSEPPTSPQSEHFTGPFNR